MSGLLRLYNEAPAAVTLPSDSPDPSDLKQALLGGSKDLADEKT